MYDSTVAIPSFIALDSMCPHPISPPHATPATETVSVIIPYYQARKKLDITLSSLIRQDYPRELTEIIVVDDGSDPPLDKSDLPEGVRLVTQHRDGFGAARARNNGATAATGNILVFADSDMVLPPDNIRCHAAFHHQKRNLYTTLCDIRIVDDETTVDIDDMDCIPYRQPKHLADLMNHMKRRDMIYNHDMIGILPGPNFAIRRDSYWHAGGQWEKFKRWGLEDTHFIYRAHARGLNIIILTDTHGFHVGTPTNRIFNASGALAEQLIPSPMYRDPNQKRSFLVPEYVVSIKSSNPDTILLSSFDVLERQPYDLMLRVDLDDIDADHIDFVQHQLENDRRVRIGAIDGALDDFPDSPFHVTIHTSSILKNGIVRRLRRRLRNFASLSAYNATGHIEIARSWHAHHRRRYPEYPLPDDMMGTLPMSALIKRGGWYDTRVPIDEPRPGRIAHLARRARYVQNVEGNCSVLMLIAGKVKDQVQRLWR